MPSPSPRTPGTPPIVVHQTTIDTPLGAMIAIASDAGLCALEFINPRRIARLDGRRRRWFPPHDMSDDTRGRSAAVSAILDGTEGWLARYFADEPGDSSEIPLDLRGTAFERRVWQALLAVPRGQTSSYGEIARRVGSPSASRAVGLANGSNPVSIIVPCHRIIGSNGSLTGYGGGLDRKAWLLQHERRWSPQGPMLF